MPFTTTNSAHADTVATIRRFNPRSTVQRLTISRPEGVCLLNPPIDRLLEAVGFAERSTARCLRDVSRAHPGFTRWGTRCSKTREVLRGCTGSVRPKQELVSTTCVSERFGARGESSESTSERAGSSFCSGGKTSTQSSVLADDEADDECPFSAQDVPALRRFKLVNRHVRRRRDIRRRGGDVHVDAHGRYQYDWTICEEVGEQVDCESASQDQSATSLCSKSAECLEVQDFEEFMAGLGSWRASQDTKIDWRSWLCRD